MLSDPLIKGVILLTMFLINIIICVIIIVREDIHFYMYTPFIIFIILSFIIIVGI